VLSGEFACNRKRGEPGRWVGLHSGFAEMRQRMTGRGRVSRLMNDSPLQDEEEGEFEPSVPLESESISFANGSSWERLNGSSSEKLLRLMRDRRFEALSLGWRVCPSPVNSAADVAEPGGGRSAIPRLFVHHSGTTILRRSQRHSPSTMDSAQYRG
jgi:hypothetical protein